MNFLAHALLSEPFAHSLIGNLAGDFVKGSLAASSLHPRVVDGVRRHRRIDVLTDGHEGYGALRSLFPQVRRRYAGPVLDVILDYYLWRNWAHCSTWNREDFVEEVYRTLEQSTALMPPLFARAFPRLRSADWLRAGTSLAGLERSLTRMGSRLRRPVRLQDDLPELIAESSLESEMLRTFLSIQGQIEDARDPHSG
ncbi:MAG: ACP phosphodiesterase [Pseudomonadota bacterium]